MGWKVGEFPGEWQQAVSQSGAELFPNNDSTRARLHTPIAPAGLRK